MIKWLRDNWTHDLPDEMQRKMLDCVGAFWRWQKITAQVRRGIYTGTHISASERVDWYPMTRDER